MLYAAIAAPPKTLPKQVDLSSQCSDVEDQGKLGSCTANAIVGNLEFLEKQGGQPFTESAVYSFTTMSALWKELWGKTRARLLGTGSNR